MATLPEVLGALAADGLSLAGAPGASAAGALVTGYLKRRTEQARQILLSELRAGIATPNEAAPRDDDIACIVRYLQAARLGAARVNLRLLAKAMVGQTTNGGLVADEFFKYAEALATLSRNEIVLLATMHRVEVAHDALVAQGFSRKNDWTESQAELGKLGWSKEQTEATAASCLRSGLILIASAYGSATFGLSPLMQALCSSVDFDDALRRETTR